MDIVKSKESGSGKKKNMLMKTWEKCRSMTIGRHNYQPNEEETFTSSPRAAAVTITKSKSWPHFSNSSKSGQKVAPEGCFSVYVGPKKQRFVVKAKHANHPLFKMLLEDSEMEYGYSSQGPILLPCEADLLYKVLAEIDNQLAHHDHRNVIAPDGYAPDYTASCSPFMNPSRRRIRDHHHGDNNIGSYGLLSSPMLKLNN